MFKFFYALEADHDMSNRADHLPETGSLQELHACVITAQNIWHR